MHAQDSPLDLESRRKIFKLIEKFPGIHFRELFRKLDLSMGSIEYHLNILEKKNFIYLQKEKGFTRYFIKGKFGEENKELAMMLRNDKLRKMLFTLILNPGISHKKLTELLSWPKATVSFYLKKLITKSIVEERRIADSNSSVEQKRTGIYVNRPDKIAQLVVTYKSGFFDELSNRILDLVEGL